MFRLLMLIGSGEGSLKSNLITSLLEVWPPPLFSQTSQTGTEDGVSIYIIVGAPTIYAMFWCRSMKLRTNIRFF